MRPALKEKYFAQSHQYVLTIGLHVEEYAFLCSIQNLWKSFLVGARADLAAPHNRPLLRLTIVQIQFYSSIIFIYGFLSD